MENINDLSREEQIDIVIGQFSGHERVEEIADILSTLASYKVTDKDYIKYYDSLTPAEIAQKISDGMLDINSDDEWQEEENSWNTILDCLRIEAVLDILENWKDYIDKYLKIENLLDDMKKRLYNDFLFKEQEGVHDGIQTSN